MSETKHWWQGYPWRMVQTNFREIDMADIDAETYASDLADFGATVVTLNAGGILASYESKLPYHMVSKYLTGSSLKEMVDACHAKGIRVIARMDFSKIPYAVYEQHPDLYAKAMTFEKDGYTWNQGESLAELAKPERVRQIKLDIIKRQEQARKQQQGTTLVDILGDDIMCTNCFI